MREGASRIGSGQREPGGQLGASAPCPVASEASSLGHLSYHGNTWAVTGARLVTSSSDSSVKRLWQASESAYPKAVLNEKAVPLLRQVQRLGQGLSLGAPRYDGWRRVNHY